VVLLAISQVLFSEVAGVHFSFDEGFLCGLTLILVLVNFSTEHTVYLRCTHASRHLLVVLLQLGILLLGLG